MTNQEKTQKAIELIASGAGVDDAISKVGLIRSKFYYWKKKLETTTPEVAVAYAPPPHAIDDKANEELKVNRTHWYHRRCDPSIGSYLMRLCQVFLDTDLRGGHHWLSEVAKEKKLDVNALSPGEMVVFVNRKKNQMKVYTAFNSVVHTKQDRIDLEAIKYLPKIFESNRGVNYSSALEKRLEGLKK